MISIFGEDGSDVSLSCQPNATTPLLYTNIVPYTLRGDWGVAYTPPVTPFPSAPAYVGGVAVGVAISEIQAFLYRASSELCTLHVHVLQTCTLKLYYDAGAYMTS